MFGFEVATDERSVGNDRRPRPLVDPPAKLLDTLAKMGDEFACRPRLNGIPHKASGQVDLTPCE